MRTQLSCSSDELVGWHQLLLGNSSQHVTFATSSLSLALAWPLQLKQYFLLFIVQCDESAAWRLPVAGVLQTLARVDERFECIGRGLSLQH